MNLTYVRGVTSDWVLKESKRMKEFIKSTVLGWTIRYRGIGHKNRKAIQVAGNYRNLF